MAEEYLTVDEARKLAKRHPKTIRRWMAVGLLTTYRVGPRGVRVKRSELEPLITPVPVREPAAR